MKRFAIITLGCKVNQCESACLASLLELRNFQKGGPDDQYQLVVINTCTVTSKAAMQSRQAVRQAIRNNPDAKIIVTGCYAQTAPQELRKIEGIDYIIGHGDKLEIPTIISQPETKSSSPIIIQKSIHQISSFCTIAIRGT